ncbi:MAG: hypothetical protein AAFR55_04370 [Pseudomonadota bacterium]
MSGDAHVIAATDDLEDILFEELGNDAEDASAIILLASAATARLAMEEALSEYTAGRVFKAAQSARDVVACLERHPDQLWDNFEALAKLGTGADYHILHADDMIEQREFDGAFAPLAPDGDGLATRALSAWLLPTLIHVMPKVAERADALRLDDDARLTAVSNIVSRRIMKLPPNRRGPTTDLVGLTIIAVAMVDPVGCERTFGRSRSAFANLPSIAPLKRQRSAPARVSSAQGTSRVLGSELRKSLFGSTQSAANAN